MDLERFRSQVSLAEDYIRQINRYGIGEPSNRLKANLREAQRDVKRSLESIDFQVVDHQNEVIIRANMVIGYSLNRIE